MQADREADKQSDRWIYRQAGKQVGRQAGRHIDLQNVTIGAELLRYNNGVACSHETVLFKDQ